MKYIMTPYHMDFIRVCQRNNFNPNGRDVIWVNSYQLFLGKKFNKEDELIKGDQYHLFPLEEQERLLMEITLRSPK